jgi:zinc/manganese transport system substrate-binding protein
VRRRFLAAALAAAAALAGCGAASGGAAGGAAAPAASGPIQVVAAENFWGSIAAQVGGPHVQVTNIIDNPNADPHSYEPTAAAARDIAAADMVIINGIGYDPWASQLVAANPAPNRAVLTVGDLLGVPQAGNPHRWYDPEDVQKVVDQLTADYTKIDPTDAASFDQQKAAFLTTDLSDYDAVIAEIKTRYAGTPIGASESIVAMLAPSLGLKVVTPPTFLRAISEGSDPGSADKTTIDAQIRDRQIKVYVYNSQNATTDVQAQIGQALAAGIPVVPITETMVPATTTWQHWQTTQLRALQAALAKATGK